MKEQTMRYTRVFMVLLLASMAMQALAKTPRPTVKAKQETAPKSVKPVVKVESPRTKKARIKLERKLTEVELDRIYFEDCIMYISENTGTNIHVCWHLLEKAHPEIREQKVVVKLKAATAAAVLKAILKAGGAGKVELGYAIEDGVVIVAPPAWLKVAANRQSIAKLYRSEKGKPAQAKKIMIYVAEGMAFKREKKYIKAYLRAEDILRMDPAHEWAGENKTSLYGLIEKQAAMAEPKTKWQKIAKLKAQAWLLLEKGFRANAAKALPFMEEILKIDPENDWAKWRVKYARLWVERAAAKANVAAKKKGEAEAPPQKAVEKK